MQHVTHQVVKAHVPAWWRRYVKGDTVLNVTPRIVEEHLQKMDNRLTILIDPARLHWTPYVASPTAGRR